MGRITDVIQIGSCVAIIALLPSMCRLYGVREERDMFTFSYNGVTSALVERDVRFGPNQYYIRIGANDIINKGTIRTDKGIDVSVDSRETMDIPFLSIRRFSIDSN